MPEPSVKETDAEIDRLLRFCSKDARLLWYEMRHWIVYECDNSGHLRRGRRPIAVEKIAERTGFSIAEVDPLLDELSGFGLLEKSEDKSLRSPHLDRLFKTKANVSGRQSRRRKRVGRDVTPYVTPDVTPAPPVPASSSFPTPLSPTPPFSPQTSSGRVPSGDEAIYRAYPRHVGKSEAIRAIASARKKLAQRGEPDPHGFLLAKATEYATARRQAYAIDPCEERFTPHPATWFNQGRYDDDLAEWRKVKPANGQRINHANRNQQPRGIVENITL